MKAIILAAGRGSRMKDKTDHLPKCLTKLWGKTLLEWQLKALREGGIDEIGIVTGYRAEEIRKRADGTAFFHNANWETTNMVSTLLEAEEWLKSDICIVSYADILYEKEAVVSLSHSEGALSLVYNTNFRKLWEERFRNPLEDVETFRLDGSRLMEIGQKASSLDEIEGQYMGLLKFTPEGWGKIREAMAAGLPKPLEKIDMTGLLSHLLGRGIAVQSIPYGGIWLEVDSPEDLALYEAWPVERRGGLM